MGFEDEGLVKPQAIFFDRDGTLVRNVPYNGDPNRVELMPHAREALEAVRAAGVKTAGVSNQSGVARGLITLQQVLEVNRRVEELVGELGAWVVCPHGPDDRCACRKPEPGLILQACEALAVDPAGCVMIGDQGSDGDAARRAGCRFILVPTDETPAPAVAAAAETAADLLEAVRRALAG